MKLESSLKNCPTIYETISEQWYMCINCCMTTFHQYFTYMQGHYPMLSDPWCEMADVLGRIASISDVVSTCVVFWRMIRLVSTDLYLVFYALLCMTGIQIGGIQRRRDIVGNRGTCP